MKELKFYCFLLLALCTVLVSQDITMQMKAPSPYAGLTYTGPVDLDGRPHGKGTMSGVSSVDKNEQYLECNFIHGVCSGFIVARNVTGGYSYSGQVVRDEVKGWNYRHGYGKSFDPGRGTYEGEWKEGKWNGFGIHVDTKGNVFTGEFFMNDPHGLCKQVKPDGTTYFGDWVHGRMHGFGNLTLPNGDRYVGEFHEGSPTGIGGSITKGGGPLIFGEFVQGRITGVAVEKNSPKDYVRIAEYKEDMVQGLIAERNSGGSLVLYGDLDGSSKSGLIYELKPDGTQYLGEVSGGKYHGRGLVFDQSGIRQFGEFVNGEFQAEK